MPRRASQDPRSRKTRSASRRRRAADARTRGGGSPHQSTPDRSRAGSGWIDGWPAATLIGVVALAVRVAHLLDAARLPVFDRPTVDAALYVEQARRIAESWVLPEVFFKPPLFAYVLGAWWRVVGEDFLLLRLPLVVLGAGTAVLVWMLGRRLFDSRVALVAGLLYALHRSAVYFEAELLEMGLVTFVHLVALLAVEHAGRTSSKARWSFVAGLALGIGCVARPTFVAFALVALWWSGRRRLLPALAGVVLAIAPVTLHNARYGRDFVLVSSNLGINFYVGNNPQANGRIASTPELPAQPAAARRAARDIAEATAGRSLRPSEVSRHWLRRGVDYALTHPARSLELAGRKLFYAWNGAAISDNEDLTSLGRYLRVYRMLPVGMWLLAPLGLVGLVAAGGRRRALQLVRAYVAIQVLAVLPFFIVERFRLPWAPVLAVLGAWTLLEMASRLQNRRATPWKLGLGVAVALAACNVPAFGVRDALLFDLDYKIAYAYQQKGRMGEAIEAYRQAVERNPGAALARNALGYLLAERGEGLDEAARLIEEALALDRTHTANYAESLAFVELRRGNVAAALRACETGLAAARDDRTRIALLLRRSEALRQAGHASAEAEDLRAILDLAPEGEVSERTRRRLEEIEPNGPQTGNQDP